MPVLVVLFVNVTVLKLKALADYGLLICFHFILISILFSWVYLANLIISSSACLLKLLRLDNRFFRDCQFIASGFKA